MWNVKEINIFDANISKNVVIYIDKLQKGGFKCSFHSQQI